MADTTGDKPLVDRVADSAIAKVSTRILLPLVVLICLPLAVAQWNGMRSDVAELNEKQAKTDERVIGLEQTMATVNTKLDAGLIWRLTQLERRFEAMEGRIERREASRPTP